MKLKVDFLTKLKRLFWDINNHTIHTLSIDKWHKIHETGNFFIACRYVRIKKSYDNLMEEYIKEFGITKEYKAQLELSNSIAIKQMECLSNPTPINKAELGILIAEMEENKSKEKVKFGQLLSYVSRKQGYQVKKDISVYEFYSILNERPN
jgi:hypothetical protein